MGTFLLLQLPECNLGIQSFYFYFIILRIIPCRKHSLSIIDKHFYRRNICKNPDVSDFTYFPESKTSSRGYGRLILACKLHLKSSVYIFQNQFFCQYCAEVISCDILHLCLKDFCTFLLQNRDCSFFSSAQCFQFFYRLLKHFFYL